MTNKTLNKIILSATTAMFLTACGGGGGGGTENQAPTAEAGDNITTTVNTAITLTGSGTDSDGTIASYSWTDASGTVLATTASFDYTPTSTGTKTFTLTVTDDDGATATDTVEITVNPTPVTPVAVASLADAADQTYTVGTIISTLTFANSGGAVSSCVVTPELPAGLAVAANNNTCEIAGTPTAVAATAAYTVTGTNDSGSSEASVNITVTDIPNQAPKAEAGDNVSVVVNTAVTLTGSGTDDDGTIESYSWTDASGAVLATTASFDYTPTSIGTEKLTFTVTDDDNATASDTVKVDVIARLADKGDGTLTDAFTGLVWDKTPSDVGSCAAPKSEPTIEQFQTIIDYSKINYAIVVGFDLAGELDDTHYKTSDNWDVRLKYGIMSNGSDANRTICVDATNYTAPEDVNYTRDDNTTLVTGTDGLVWTDSELFTEVNASGDTVIDYNPQTWDDARNKCQDLNMSLPTLVQLDSLYDRTNRKIISDAFQTLNTAYYWSSDVAIADTNQTWVVNFNTADTNAIFAGQITGMKNANIQDDAHRAYVRCVK